MLMDTTGQKLFWSLESHIYKDSNCFILGYDITSRDSFNDIKYDYFFKIMDFVKNDELIYLVGNKIE